MLLSPSTRLQRSIVKASYAPNRRRGAWGAHGVYLAREGAQREGERGLGFDAERDAVDLVATLRAWQRAGDERLWKFVVSPEHAASLDLREHARELVGHMQRDLGTRLDWVAIDHYNTDNPHMHLLVRGPDGGGRELRMPPGDMYYWKSLRGADAHVGKEVSLLQTLMAQREYPPFTAECTIAGSGFWRLSPAVCTCPLLSHNFGRCLV